MKMELSFTRSPLSYNLRSQSSTLQNLNSCTQKHTQKKNQIINKKYAVVNICAERSQCKCETFRQQFVWVHHGIKGKIILYRFTWTISWVCFVQSISILLKYVLLYCNIQIFGYTFLYYGIQHTFHYTTHRTDIIIHSYKIHYFMDAHKRNEKWTNKGLLHFGSVVFFSLLLPSSSSSSSFLVNNIML